MTQQFDKVYIRRRFERAAQNYSAAAVIFEEILKRLLARLDYIKMKPAVILDLGCGVGAAVPALRQRYPKAKVIGLDLAKNMLQQTKRKLAWRAKSVLQADMDELPLKNDTVDLIVSSGTLQYTNHVDELFAELSRVLKPEGLLMFSSFGPDTLCELKAASASVGLSQRVQAFSDMHDLGDAMLQAGLLDPVVDAESLQISYAEVDAGLRELHLLAGGNANLARPRGLIGRHKYQQLLEAYPRAADKRCYATLEMIYGHAWGSATVLKKTDSGGTEVHISLDTLRQSARNKK